MVALGYGYLIFVVLGTVAAISGLLALILAFQIPALAPLCTLLGLFLLAAVQSLPVMLKLPEKLIITRKEAPALYAEVEAIADRLKALRPDQIQIDERFNAAAAQYPRFGIVGKSRIILTLGLPYLLASTPDEMRAVIGHELGHFSGKHDRLEVSVYRIEAMWDSIYRNLQRSGKDGAVFRPFFKWYTPRFFAMSFAVRRQNEREADALAAEITSTETTARALRLSPVRLDLINDRFWKPFGETLASNGLPERGFLDGLATAVRQPLDVESGRRALEEALARETNLIDTQPALRDRLKALGQPLEGDLSPLTGPSAAEVLLGDSLPSIVRRVEEKLLKDNGEFWKHYHIQQAQSLKHREELLKAVESNPLSSDEAIELALFDAEEAEDLAECVATFRRLVEQFPASDRAACYLGGFLLQSNDPSGAEILETRSLADPSLREYAIGHLDRYYGRTGEQDKWNRVHAEVTAMQDRRQMARNGTVIRLEDTLLVPVLSPSERTNIAEQLRKMPDVDRAYAFRKQLPGTGEIRDYLYVLPRPRLEIKDESQKLVKAIAKQVHFRGRTQIYCIQPRRKWRKRLDKLDGALVYDREIS